MSQFRVVGGLRLITYLVGSLRRVGGRERERDGGSEAGEERGGEGMPRVAQEGHSTGTLNRKRQVGMASGRSLIGRRWMIDTLVALLNLFFLTANTCLDLTMLTATDTSRHIAMTHAYIALHFADIRKLGEAP